MRASSRLLAVLILPLAACGVSSAATGDTGFGPHPALPAPESSLFPTLNVAPAQTRQRDTKPTAPDGFTVSAFATGLVHPRWLYTLPNGDVLVAESNTPAAHDTGSGIKGWVTKQYMKRAGAGVPSPDRIMLLRDADGNGTAETQTVFVDGLHSPFGMALIGDHFYVADTDALLRFDYKAGDSKVASAGVKVADLPAGPINHHWTKNILASRDGKRLYITVGSNSNAGENGEEAEADRARILEFDIASGQLRPYATGLRNPNGMSWQPDSGALWTAVNERDELGNNLVPDYMTAVKEDAFYGFPMFYEARLFPAHYRGGAFVGQHGSWNRKPHSGYKVIFVPFAKGLPAGDPEDFLTGFLTADGHAVGRPVGVAIDHSGALLVADDVGNTVWRVAPTHASGGKQ